MAAVVIDIEIEPYNNFITEDPEIVVQRIIDSLDSNSHSQVQEQSKDESLLEGDTDSGRWSYEFDLPGADLFQSDFTKEFSEQVTPVSNRSTIPTPPPLPPLLSSSFSRSSFNLDLPGAGLPDLEFRRAFSVGSIRPVKLRSLESVHAQTSPSSESPQPPSLCPICLESSYNITRLHCCGEKVCIDCIRLMIKTNITEGRTFMPCPLPNCNKPLKRNFIVEHISDVEIQLKYERFRLNHEGDGTKKTCPNCCIVTERNLPSHISKLVTPENYKVICDGCSFDWCFNCHSPWHEGISCEAYRLGDKQFYKWTKGRLAGYVPNCQKCPKCKVYIERSTGCDHMTCNQCHSHFCYKCGGYFRSFLGLGNHHKSLAVLGCPYNYLPDKPVKRRLLRGGYLFARGAALTAYPVILVGGVGILLVGAAVVVPIGAAVIGTAALYRYIKMKRQRRHF